MRNLTRALAAVAIVAGGASALAIEPWEIVLREQLQVEFGCRAVAFSNVRDFQLAGNRVIDGHVSCDDGRAYDFSRPQEHMKFEFRQCVPIVC